MLVEFLRDFKSTFFKNIWIIFLLSTKSEMRQDVIGTIRRLPRIMRKQAGLDFLVFFILMSQKPLFTFGRIQAQKPKKHL